MVGISHLQQLYLNTSWLDLIIMGKPNGESHTYACVTERQLSGKQFSIMYIRKRPIQSYENQSWPAATSPKLTASINMPLTAIAPTYMFKTTSIANIIKLGTFWAPSW